MEVMHDDEQATFSGVLGASTQRERGTATTTAAEDAWQRALAITRAIFPAPPPVLSRRLLPLMDFNSNLPINNKQLTFGELMDCAEREGTDKQEVFRQLGLHRTSCRYTMQQGAADQRLMDPPPSTRMSFAHPLYSSKLDAPPCTLSSRGDTAPVTPLLPVPAVLELIREAAARRHEAGL